MNIDWSKAPEGATHKLDGGCWYKVEGDSVSFYYGKGQWSTRAPLKDYASEWESFIPKPPKNCSFERREVSARALYCEINWNDGAAGWERLLESRKDDYRKAVDAGWQQVNP